MSSPSTSYYRATVAERMFGAPLVGAHDARVCVVGGGFAGLNTALGLIERGERDVVLLESERVGHGASGRNGGFVFGGFSLGEQALLRQQGADRARRLYAGTRNAVVRIRERV
ncbi:MAG: FAD-binding oxidoreductase, partial [Pseudomonas sp.]|nr:FAD-binding oxidoreductase [Pseudomonas sp.]